MAPTENTKHYRAKAFIFDLDGTLINTNALVERFWHEFAMENGLDGEKILETSHGVRAYETMKKWAPEKATEELATDFEKRLADESEGVSLMPGVCTLLQKIPSNRWGIYTGGNLYMAKNRLDQCNLTIPRVFVCGDMVTHGKPHPEGYLRAVEELGFRPEEVIVFEDAPAGVKAAHASGAQVIACKTTHRSTVLKEAGADAVTELLTNVDLTILPDGSFEVQVKNVCC